MKKFVLLFSIFLFSCNSQKSENEVSEEDQITYDDVKELINDKVAKGEAKSYNNYDELVEEESGVSQITEGDYYNEYDRCVYRVMLKIIPIKGDIGLKYIKVTEFGINSKWEFINPSAIAEPVINDENYNYFVIVKNCKIFFKYNSYEY